jgi:DNA-binding HxlR family transcriptional regulator
MATNAPMVGCPIAASLGVLGRKWTLLVLREMSMKNVQRFSDLLRGIPGLTPRMLSARLKELEREGIIQKTEVSVSPNSVRWALTEKGWDSLPILMSFFAFGSKWHPEGVFADGLPREVREVYPQKNLRKSYVNLTVESRQKE